MVVRDREPGAAEINVPAIARDPHGLGSGGPIGLEAATVPAGGQAA